MQGWEGVPHRERDELGVCRQLVVDRLGWGCYMTLRHLSVMLLRRSPWQKVSNVPLGPEIIRPTSAGQTV